MPMDEIDEFTLARIRKDYNDALEHSQVSKERFLIAWKKAVAMAGQRLFTSGKGYPQAPTLNAATDKWQLIPDYDAIVDFIKVASTGEALFITVLYSFYNSEDGDAMLHQLGFHGLGDIANRLDSKQLEVVTELMRYHTGW